MYQDSYNSLNCSKFNMADMKSALGNYQFDKRKTRSQRKKDNVDFDKLTTRSMKEDVDPENNVFCVPEKKQKIC